MDEGLKKQLKEMNLLPLELDEELQKFYREQNIDPSVVETHHSPGASPHAIERYERIQKNALRLNEMELESNSGSEEYKRIEGEIKKDLFECIFPTAEEVIYRMIRQGKLYTGVCGDIRDTILFKSNGKA